MAACPKCGLVQEGTEECGRCGIVFRKYRPAGLLWEPPKPMEGPPPPRPGAFRRFYRFFRWITLGTLLLVLALLLREAPPPAVQSAPDAVERVSSKVEEFRRATQTGMSSQLQLNEAELNGWVRSNVALKGQARPTDIARSVMSGEAAPTAPTAGNVSDLRMNLVDDHLRAWVMFEVRGVDLTLEIEGKLSTRDGYVRLQPTSGRLGSLPLSQSILENAARRLFESPENREKFKLPDHIAEIRVENSELTVLSR